MIKLGPIFGRYLFINIKVQSAINWKTIEGEFAWIDFLTGLDLDTRIYNSLRRGINYYYKYKEWGDIVDDTINNEFSTYWLIENIDNEIVEFPFKGFGSVMRVELMYKLIEKKYIPPPLWLNRSNVV